MAAKRNFYVDNKRKFIKQFKKYSKIMKKALQIRFDDEQVDKIMKEALQNYEELLPQIPYIGGFKNSGTRNLIGSALGLSYIKALEPLGLSEKEIGNVIYDFFRLMFKPKPKFIQNIVKYLLGKKFFKNMLLKQFEKKKKFEKYEAAWATQPIYDENGEMQLGLDIKRCGICVFFKQQKMEKYIKYMCLGDYPMFGSLGLYLHRTKTYAGTNEVCDYKFTFKDGGRDGWPPEKLEEWENYK